MMKGSNIIDNIIDKLPFELHVPFHSYCGPIPKLQKRINRGDPGNHALDEACKHHDIAYAESNDLK